MAHQIDVHGVKLNVITVDGEEWVMVSNIAPYIAEALKPSHNPYSPKLPEFKECIKDICSGQVGLREQHIYRRGAEWMYNFIVGKIGLI
jgi:hypothetical protein